MVMSLPRYIHQTTGRARVRPGLFRRPVLQVEVKVTSYRGSDFDQKYPLHTSCKWVDATFDHIQQRPAFALGLTHQDPAA